MLYRVGGWILKLAEPKTPGPETFMRKYFWKVVGGIIAGGIGVILIALVLMEGFVTEDYSAVCTQCLQQVHGVDKFFLGIRVSHQEQLDPANEPLWLHDGDGEVVADPSTYEQIFGRPCAHHFIRLGFGRQSGGLGGDGIYAQPPNIYVRLALIGRLFEAYHRVPNRMLAQETYSIIDQGYPESIGWNAQTPMPSVSIAEAVPNEPMSILYRGLVLLRTSQDWRTLIDAAKAHDGSLPMLKNVAKGG